MALIKLTTDDGETVYTRLASIVLIEESSESADHSFVHIDIAGCQAVRLTIPGTPEEVYDHIDKLNQAAY